jgi:hypothetical protein
MMVLAVLATSCGKKGAPLPPLRPDPQPVTELKVGQQGNHLLVSYVSPRVTVDDQRLDVHDVEILVAERAGELAKVAHVTRVRVAPGESRTETLPLPAAGTSLRVAARARSKGGRSAISKIESFVVHAVPDTPADVAASNDPGGVIVTWATPTPTPIVTPTAGPTSGPTSALTGANTPTPTGPTPLAAPVFGSKPVPTATPVNVSGYQVSRRGPTGLPLLLTEKPIAGPPFLDQKSLDGGRWCYTVRSVASLTPLLASDDSIESCVEVRDVRPPQPPTGLTLVPREEALDLTWSPSPDTDVTTYRIYRSPAGDEPQRIGERPAAERSFHDPAAAPGVIYRYRVTALDGAGNESAPSTPVEGGRP